MPGLARSVLHTPLTRLKAICFVIDHNKSGVVLTLAYRNYMVGVLLEYSCTDGARHAISQIDCYLSYSIPHGKVSPFLRGRWAGLECPTKLLT